MKIPFKAIGEHDWVAKFSKFINELDVELEPASEVEIKRTEERLDCELPESMLEYFKHIGVYDETEFMPLLYPLDSFSLLSDSDWKKIKKDFDEDELENYVVFAESIDGMPVCFEKNSGHIYMFSSTPPAKGMVFNDFNDYVINEVLNVLLDGRSISEEDELELKEDFFDNTADIDDEMRMLFLFGGYSLDEDDYDDDFYDEEEDEEDYFDDYDE